MNKPLKDTLKRGGWSSEMKQFFLSLLATTISIVLTFGTSAVIEHSQKEKAKREMVKMIIYDFDKTIEYVEKANNALDVASRQQQELAIHPEYFDSLRFEFTSAIMITGTEFSETTENIFSSNIETFNTLGNVNFVHEVSSFYTIRHQYQQVVLDNLKQEVEGSRFSESINNLFHFNFPEYYYTNWVYLNSLKYIRNNCMTMMKVSEEEMKEFSNLRSTSEDLSIDFEPIEEEELDKYIKASNIVSEAQKKYNQDE